MAIQINEELDNTEAAGYVEWTTSGVGSAVQPPVLISQCNEPITLTKFVTIIAKFTVRNLKRRFLGFYSFWWFQI